MAKKTLDRIKEFLHKKGFDVIVHKNDIDAMKEGFEIIVEYDPKKGNKIVDLFLLYDGEKAEALINIVPVDKVFYSYVKDKENGNYYQISFPYRSQRIYALEIIEQFVKDPVETTLSNMYSFLAPLDKLLEKVARFGYLKDY
jgi:hypothetical protein